MKDFTKTGLCLSLAASGFLMSACGGGAGVSEPTPPPPSSTATAADDAYSLDWNVAKRLSVQDNDKSSGGTTSLSIVEAPKNGTASVEGALLVYTPNTGFFGQDSLKYRLSVGGSSSDAAVKITVQASVALKGMVSDGPIAGAKVVATLGSQSVSTDADSQGVYSLILKSSDPTEFLSLKASGVGAQSQVVLSSLAGEIGSLSQLSPIGLLTESQVPALRINHFSTAQTALLARRGPLPNNDKTLAEQARVLSASDLIDGASAIKMVVDQGYSLPSGISNTQDLLQSGGKFIDIINAQRNINPTLFDQVRASLDQDAGLKFAPPVPSQAPRTLVYAAGVGGSTGSAYQFVLQTDGSVQVLGDFAATGQWKLNGTALQISLDSPNVSTSNSSELDAQGLPWSIDTVVTGYRLVDWSLANGSSSMALLTPLGYTLEHGGSKAGQQQAFSEEAQALKRFELAAANSFSAADFATGTRWAGPYSGHLSETLGGTLQDIVKFTGSATAVAERNQQAVSWQLVDGVLELTLPDSNYRYRRLGIGPLGEERWLMEQRVAGKSLALKEIMAVKAGDLSLFSNQLTLPWVGNLNASSGQATIYELRSDGSASISVQSTGDTQSSPDFSRRWRVGLDARLELRLGRTLGNENCDAFAGDINCQLIRQNYWRFVGQLGGTLFALEEGPYVGGTRNPVQTPTGTERRFRLVAFTDPSYIK